eukprot:12798783-Heterocapsa_arctica.AAC.1
MSRRLKGRRKISPTPKTGTPGEEDFSARDSSEEAREDGHHPRGLLRRNEPLRENIGSESQSKYPGGDQNEPWGTHDMDLDTGASDASFVSFVSF